MWTRGERRRAWEAHEDERRAQEAREEEMRAQEAREEKSVQEERERETEAQEKRVRSECSEGVREREKGKERFGRFIIGLPLSYFHQTLCVSQVAIFLRCHHGTALGMALGMDMAREERVDGPTPGERSIGGVLRTRTGSSSLDARQQTGGKTRSW